MLLHFFVVAMHHEDVLGLSRSVRLSWFGWLLILPRKIFFGSFEDSYARLNGS